MGDVPGAKSHHGISSVEQSSNPVSLQLDPRLSTNPLRREARQLCPWTTSRLSRETLSWLFSMISGNSIPLVLALRVQNGFQSVPSSATATKESPAKAEKLSKD